MFISTYKFGAAMALVKSDIGGNISVRYLFSFLLFHLQRLEDKYSSNPTEFNLLYSMVEVEVAAKTAKGSSSCTNGLLWLTRYPLSLLCACPFFVNLAF
ncbi:Glycolipid transfer protein 1 [Vitis vinifera]|uniref:Glycolipid transfer protein 1 n=1 Tax=Vitis vinifera TaxID=29760 RepID=A0A438GHW7_VITVI|nr:Glycolipid transfer protein 1 [Vitis vinifera]